LNTAIKKDFVTDLAESFRFDDASLPTMPDAVRHLQKALSNSAVDVGWLSSVLQRDPVLAARIIRVANCPVYRTIQPVECVADAVMRIGLTQTRNVALMLLENSFTARHRLIDDRICWLWTESLHIASIAETLARHYRFIRPDRAVLGGLLSNVGALLLLTHIDQKLDNIDNDKILDIIIQQYAAEFGARLLRYWEMDSELQLVAENRDNWQREHGAPPDLADLVLLAKACRAYDCSVDYGLPSHKILPAYEKIEAIYPRNVPLPGVIAEASTDIRAMIDGLSGE